MIDSPPPTLADRARWAVALYANVWEDGRETTRMRDRAAGIRRYKNAPAARLRRDLEPVLRAYPDGTVQRSAAAYVLARYGVDPERNVERLFQSGRMGRGIVEDNQESLPEALGDLWIVRRSPAALRRLLTMPSDGAVGEIQASEIIRVFKTAPDTVLRAARRTTRGWNAFVDALYIEGAPKGVPIREEDLWARALRDAKRLG